ncbi:MAG: hypothetical protein HY960_16200 [Ignavibacteriae bacterium]|nr:hypothetical protein [Ignavibacteriota bacterium]
MISSTYIDYSGSYSDRRNSISSIFLDTNYQNINKSYSVSFKGILGFGYGRLRDGTIVFHALRIIERLCEDGLITKFINREQMLSLVNRIAHKREYLTNYERYEKYFVSDLVEELAREGLIPETAMNAFSSFRILETFKESIQPRFFGWKIYYTFGGHHRQYKYETPYGSGFENDWVDIHTIGGEYGYPLSLYTHASAKAKIELPNQDYHRKFDLEINVSVTHELAEKLEFIGSYSFQRQASNITRNGGDNYWWKDTDQSISGNFIYYLEDDVRFTTSLVYSKSSKTDYNDNSVIIPISTKYSSVSFSFGLNYNIF